MYFPIRCTRESLGTPTLSHFTPSALPDWAFIPGTLEETFGALNSQGQSSFPTFVHAMATDGAQAFPNQKQRYYQVTWEPEPTWGYNGTIAELVQYYSLSYSTIKPADPEAFVVGPTLFIDHVNANADIDVGGQLCDICG